MSTSKAVLSDPKETIAQINQILISSGIQPHSIDHAQDISWICVTPGGEELVSVDADFGIKIRFDRGALLWTEIKINYSEIPQIGKIFKQLNKLAGLIK